MKNRSRYEVIAAILRSSFREETRTKLMYRAMLSNDQCKLYLESLLEIDLLSEVQTGNKIVYRITQKGRRFLSFYIQMQKMLPVGIGEDSNGQYFPLDANAI
ncbi:MAG: winged helix-turn-helix domain-containing protein [Nitrososphaeraceae archaeon]